MQKLLTFFLSILIVPVFGQDNCQTVSIGTNYESQTFYSLENGVVHTITADDWDIRMNFFDYAFHINEAVVTNCWVNTTIDNADLLFGTDNQTYDPTTLDITGMMEETNGWVQVHNSLPTRTEGAMNRMKQTPPKGGVLEYGHSFYAPAPPYSPMHAIRGYQVFVVELRDGSMHQFWPQISHSSSQQVFSYANIDGSNQQDFVANRDNYSDQQYMYLSIINGGLQTPTFAPNATDYDLVFTNYFNEDLGQFIPGVLANAGVGLSQKDNTPIQDVVFDGTYDTDDAHIIGDDWKAEVTPTNYDITPDLTYLIQSVAGNEYGLSFCDFGGIQNGNYEFVLLTRDEIENGIPPTSEFTADVTTICPGDMVQFQDNSQNANSYEWTFEGGNPTTSTDPNPMVTFDNSGNYTVTLEVFNGIYNDVQEKVNYITVEFTPTADFVANINDLDANFTSTSTSANTYSWDFGDGNSSTDENPNHTYAVGGTYQVTLTVTNACDTDVFVESVTVTEPVLPPVASFSANSTQDCPDAAIEFTNNSPNADTYNWTFEGGNPATSTDPNPMVTYHNSGTFNVTLQVSNSAGTDTENIADYITILALPTADFSSFVNDLNADFISNSTDANTYAWDFGDGNSSTDENPNHTYAAAGTYQVTLTVTNTCDTDVFVESVTVTEPVLPPVASFSANSTSGCPGETILFTSNSPNADTYNWTFEGGNPATSTDPNPDVTYDNSGTFNVTLQVSNSAGSDTESTSNYIEISLLPVASFGFNTDGLLVDFSNSSDNSNTQVWDFGDGNTSTDANPTHTYAADGTYTVTLTTNNNCGEDVMTINIQVQDNIDAPGIQEISADIQEGCGELTTNFSAAVTGADTYSWTFEGGTPATSSEQNPSVSYSEAGVFNVTLQVSNSAGSDIQSEIDFITVNAFSEADFNANTNELTVNFTNNSTAADTYLWDFGDGNTSTDANPTHTYGEDGTYTVILAATGACGDVMTTQTVTVAENVVPPIAAFATNSQSGCVPFEVTFTQQSSNAEAFEWTFEGGTPATSTEPNPTVMFDQEGSFNVSLTVTNSAGNDTQTEVDYIVVNGEPEAGFSTSIDEATVSFISNATNGISFSWDFGDGNTSNEENPEHTFTENGIYTVIQTVTGFCGSASIEQEITINITPDLPLASFEINQDNICVGDAIQFTNQSINADSYEWEFEGGTPATSTEENPVIVYNETGIFTVTLIATNSEGADQEISDDLILVNDLPASEFDYTIQSNEDRIVEFSPVDLEAGNTYNWDFGDGNFSTEAMPVHQYDTDGTYEVQLMIENDCGTAFGEEAIVFTVNTEENLYLEQLIVSPNPNNGRFSIILPDNWKTSSQLTIYNQIGQVIHQAIIPSNQNTYWIDAGDVPGGVYYLEMELEGKKIRKIVMME